MWKCGNATRLPDKSKISHWKNQKPQQAQDLPGRLKGLRERQTVCKRLGSIKYKQPRLTKLDQGRGHEGHGGGRRRGAVAWQGGGSAKGRPG